VHGVAGLSWTASLFGFRGRAEKRPWHRLHCGEEHGLNRALAAEGCSRPRGRKRGKFAPDS